MKYTLSLLFTLFSSFLLFSQVITFECNNEIITVSFDQIGNNPNAYIDWNGDGQINEEDYVIYLSQVYGCNDVDCNEDLQDCNEDQVGCYNDNGGFYEIADVMLYDDCNGMICESANNWVSYIVPGCEEEPEIITFECNNQIITVATEDFIDNLNANIDWNEDGQINNDDLLIYLNQIYGCNNSEEFQWDQIDWEDDNWEDYNWEVVWSDLDLGNFVNWSDIPWDDIINLDILPDDLINYINGMSLSQPFDWNNFISSQGCVDDDQIISVGLSIWTDVDGCADALLYLESLDLDCNTPLNLKFVSADSIALSEICCETCQNTTPSDDCCINPAWIDPFAMCFTLWDPVIGCDGIQYSNSCVAENAGVTSWTNQMGDEVVIDWDCSNANNDLEGCTDPNACNYDSNANIDDGSCVNEINPGILDAPLEPLCYGDEITIEFVISPSGGNGNYSYQWQVSQSGGTFEDIPAANSSTYVVTNNNSSTENMTYYYRVIVTSNYCISSASTNLIAVDLLSGTGCSDPEACNYDDNLNDCFNTSNCDYGVQCFVSPCSTSDNPGIIGAFCIDDYCEGCCALWYNADGTLLSNSCDVSIKENSYTDNYIRITDLLGRDNEGFKYEIIIFHDGTIEKKYLLDNE